MFSDAAPVCGFDVATIPVDSGVAAFVDDKTAAQLSALSDSFHAQGKNIYDDFFAAEVGHLGSFAQMTTLPDGGTFPIFTSGWGDGSYPVATLVDADEKTVAVYVDFMGRNAAGEWLLPQTCDPKMVS